jgi:hypothetical protein
MELDVFLRHVFGDVSDDEVVGIVQRGKTAHGWQATPHKVGRTKLRPDAASYYCISTLKKPSDGEPLRRLMPNTARCGVIVLDDIGTKIDVGKFNGKAQPHYVMETSAGNYQYGFKFAGALEEAQVLIEAMIEAGYSDPGARDVHRLVRLPGSLNFKYTPPFVARLVEENWDQPAWTFKELVEEFDLTPREPTSLRSTKRAWSGDAGGDVILRWMTEKGMALSEPNEDGWAFIECPWSDEHSDGRTDAKWQVGNGASGVWHCFHGACQHRTHRDFLLWCAENGAPDFEVEAATKIALVGQKLATVPRGVFALPGPLRPAPDGTAAGDILTGLVLTYAARLKKERLPSLEVTSKAGVAKDVQKATVENVQYVVGECEFSVLKNHMTGEVELSHADKAFDVITSPMERALMTREFLISLANRVGISLRATLDELLHTMAANNGYHPVCDWIAEKPWDGVDRFRALADTLETPNPQWRDIVLLRASIQAVVLWTNWTRETPVSGPHVVVLVGPQGCGKSTFIGSLLPSEWRLLEQTANLGHASSKDDERRLTSSPLVELSELESIISRVEAGHLKSFLSRPVDKMRLPYDRTITTRARGTSFWATVNDSQFLNDPTGARRFWPIEVTKCNAFHNIDMQQYWAQMMYLVQNKERWNLSPEEAKLHSAIVEEHRVESPAEGRLQELRLRMKFIPKEEWAFATASDIARYYSLPDNYATSRAVGGVLRKMFGERVSNNERKGWRVPIKQIEFRAGFSAYMPPEGSS